MPRLRFVEGYREGQQFATPSGEVTLGPERIAQCTDDQARYLFEAGYGCREVSDREFAAATPPISQEDLVAEQLRLAQVDAQSNAALLHSIEASALPSKDAILKKTV